MPSPSSSSSSSSCNSWMIGRQFHLMSHSHRSIKTRFAYRFLRALKKLNNNQKKPIIMEKKPTRRRRSRRYHMVKTAAYVSMASAVGTRRAWSRALLSNIRNRHRTNTILRRRRHHHHQNPNDKEEEEEEEEEEGTTEQLKKLVPGGEVMDFCSLLDETAHYIKCLTSQVET